MFHKAAAITGLVLAVSACASPMPSAPTSLTRAEEVAPSGVAPSSSLRLANYHAATPNSVPGAKTITTADLNALVQSQPPPVLIDVLGGNGHETLPNATWLRGAGLGSDFNDQTQARLVKHAMRLTGSDKGRTVVVFCLSEMCWLSYNTSLRLAQAGFTDVRWYRGGHEAWIAARLPTQKATLTAL